MILSQVCLSFFLSKETDWRDGLAKPFWKADGRRLEKDLQRTMDP